VIELAAIAPRILIVEDEGIIADHVASVLRKAGYEVAGIAASSQEVFANISERLPDLILMDIHIDGLMDGIKTAEKVLESLVIPIVYLSAHSDELTVNRAKATGPFQFLTKPIDWTKHLHPCRYVLDDRDTKFCASFRSTLAGGGVKTIRLPARSPNLNPFAEHWVRSVKQECLSKLILFGEGPLSRTLAEFSAHYHWKEITKGRTRSCYFLRLATNPKSAAALLSAVPASEAYSNIMDAPHE
jgi:CheY-like chemotaxis protein